MRNRTLLLIVTAAFIAGGCGGGGSTDLITTCSLTEFMPNYAAQMKHLLTWPAFPVRVFFVDDGNLTTARQTRTLAGFNQWAAATNGKVHYQIATSGSNAEITVRFDPTTSNGLTRLTFVGRTLRRAEIEIGVESLGFDDIQCIAAHEFGHALGLDGHSDSPDDLMYSIHIIGTACPISIADLNTLKTGYCGLFSDRSSHIAPAHGPTRTIIIE